MLDFIGIGAQKAGTSWLYEKLRLHPEIAFPAGKEVHFWDQQYARGISWYQALFAANQHSGMKVGEITPAYSILPIERIRECRSRSPRLRLIYLLRNPIERAWSAAKMALVRSEMKIHEASDQWFLDHFRSSGSRARGNYSRCIANWSGAYSKEQLQLCFFEELLEAPKDLLRKCFRHIGVDASNYDWSVDLREAVFKSPTHEMPTSLRRELQQIYFPEISELERALDVDLNRWRQ